ncbi:MAG TPA: P1 family peptidase [Candidatus Dormibacteraeota bacterium]|nr:P1 family peptidase [Candidatus Dormibacteraeota bacterium]HVC23907.1 P1 family peptidase [Candidatus Dormibacteraeota bacterium]
MTRGRLREYGIEIGRLLPGPGNSITDVAGTSVGHVTLSDDGTTDRQAVRTGITVVWPHEGQPWRERVYAATAIVNGYGEMIGINQINEWGLLHSPVLLTSSLAIGAVYDGATRWIADQDPVQGIEDVIMPVVTECDDSYLNDARSFPIQAAHVYQALDAARQVGSVQEGSVGAATGLQCFDFKGGIGTASRLLPPESGGYTVGALVSTNFGARSDLCLAGVPLGRDITDLMPRAHTSGSCIVILATDAPMLPHQLRRLASRGGLGLARCGSIGANGSGELVLAFSTATRVPRAATGNTVSVRALLDGAYWHEPSVFDPIFTAAIEAVEEAVGNALFQAETTFGRDGHVLHALPLDRALAILDRHGAINRTH